MKDCEGGVAYIKARGDQDTLHYVVTTIGPPTVLVIMTQNTDNAVHEGISIDWQRLKSDNMTVLLYWAECSFNFNLSWETLHVCIALQVNFIYNRRVT
jgi:hypothetical protein